MSANKVKVLNPQQRQLRSPLIHLLLYTTHDFVLYSHSYIVPRQAPHPTPALKVIRSSSSSSSYPLILTPNRNPPRPILILLILTSTTISPPISCSPGCLFILIIRVIPVHG